MSLRRGIGRDRRGVTALEFAFAMPVLVLIAIGAVQLGVVGLARSGLHQAVDEGARYATIYPTPSDAQIVERVRQSAFGLNSAYLSDPTVSHGTDHGIAYTDVGMSYSMPLNFVFFQTSPITLSYTRRAY